MGKHLMGISRFLSHAGRLVLVNSIYSAMTTFYMCSLKMPLDLLEQIDKYREHVLWHGGMSTRKVVIWWLGNRLVKVKLMVAWGLLI
jgi:hypothetical protein